MSGASWRRRERMRLAASRHVIPRRAVSHRRACASLVASFRRGVAVWIVGGRYGCHQPRRADQKRPLFQSQNNGSRNNQESTNASNQGESFAEKECSKQNDEGDTQFVDGGHAHGLTKLESAKVTEPGQASCQTR